MSEGELDRLRRVVERLMAGHREALEVIDQEVENQSPLRRSHWQRCRTYCQAPTMMRGPS
jgi:hypothetical protein